MGRAKNILPSASSATSAGGGGGSDGGDGGSGGGDGGSDGGGSGGALGATCSDNSDCASNFCIKQYASDDFGVCTQTCDSWADCDEAFWECCDLSNGGFACTPDSWVDEFGLTCQ